MKVAITYQHSLELGGSERVLEVLADMYPGADFFCMLAKKSAIPPRLIGRSITCSFLNDIPFAKRFYPCLLFLAPLAAEMLDLSEYDLVISSDGSHTMGVLTRQNALHICYCHSPHRSIWDQYHSYSRRLRFPVSWIFNLSAHYARICNFLAAQRVDYFVANSRYVNERIRKYYHRDSVVIYPPIDTAKGYITDHPGDYYLSVGRLTYAKRVDLLIEACNRLHRHLVIAGSGSEEKCLKAMAGPTIEFLGRVPDAELPELYANCRAFLFASDEDFGIVPVEAQSYGRPVVAYGHGGSLETVRVGDPEGRSDTGVFFSQQTVESVMEGIQCFEARRDRFVSEEIQMYARQFDTSVFVREFRKLVDSVTAHMNA